VVLKKKDVMPNKPVTIKDVYESVECLRHEIAKNYVTKDEFAPVKSIAYGLMAIIATTVFAAILAQVVKAFL
jgi:ABC-type phosphate transport system permease subunit